MLDFPVLRHSSIMDSSWFPLNFESSFPSIVLRSCLALKTREDFRRTVVQSDASTEMMFFVLMWWFLFWGDFVRRERKRERWEFYVWAHSHTQHQN